MSIRIKPELKNCHDCGAKPGQPHNGSCDVERCSVCGGQRLQCSCEGHDPLFARWTGLWPGTAECWELGLLTKWTDHGWQTVDKTDPEARADLNTFHKMWFQQIFFVKPKPSE